MVRRGKQWITKSMMTADAFLERRRHDMGPLGNEAVWEECVQHTDLIFEATSNGAAVVYGCLFIDYNFFHFVF